MKKWYHKGNKERYFEEGTQPEGFIKGRKEGLLTADSKKKIAKSYRESCLRKYGVTNTAKLQSSKDAAKATNNKKYGCDWFTQTDKCVEVTHTDEIISRQNKSREETYIAKYGYERWLEVQKDKAIDAYWKSLSEAEIDNYIITTLNGRTEYDVTTHSLKRKIQYAKLINTLINAYGSLDNAYKEIYKSYTATMNKLYGVDNYFQTAEFMTKARKKYIYDNTKFDSSWELALYIYAKDNGEHIERLPCKLLYTYDGKKHYYNPDFLYNNELVEIKGCNLIDEGELIDFFECGLRAGLFKAKQKCMIKNNVKLLEYKDVKKYLDYVSNTYGSNYMKQFKEY